MKLKNTGLTAGGQTHAEIRPGDIWRDNHGMKITVSTVSANRVVYFREGRPEECFCSPARLHGKFSFVSAGPAPEAPDDHSRIMQATSCAERLRITREIIQERKVKK